MTDNLSLWNQVAETNPANTKAVNQRGGFTAINAHSQIMAATSAFGPIGIGWGYETDAPIFHDNLVMIPVTLWHGDRGNRFGPMVGCEEWKDSKGRLDSDATKKATTDAITKLLSQLGFNADVFLGKYDDQKYVNSLHEKYAEKPELPDAVINLIAEIQAAPIADLPALFKEKGQAFQNTPHKALINNEFNKRKAA